MSATWSLVGALLLLAATAPQVVRLVRTRRADDFSLGFAALNVAGLVFLSLRSWEIGEGWFLTLNLTTASFWLAIVLVKLVPVRARLAAAAVTGSDAP